MGIRITLVSSLLVIVFLARKMEDLSKLKEMGESLGYEGDKLRDFVREQQAQQRKERAAVRQKEKDERDYKLKIEIAVK